MIEPIMIATLQKIHTLLNGCQADWVVTGSLGMALQGVPVSVHDIDIQTDHMGAYELEERLCAHVTTPVHLKESGQMRSHFGRFEMDGVQVEIMSDIQRRIDENTWDEPTFVATYREWVDAGGMQVPVMNLEYEVRAYRRWGRQEKAEMLKRWLQEKAQTSMKR